MDMVFLKTALTSHIYEIVMLGVSVGPFVQYVER